MTRVAMQAQSRQDAPMIEGARQLLKARRAIVGLAPKGLFRDSAWDIMLELFINDAEGGVLYVKHIMLASGESAAAAMRRIERLHEADFLRRYPDPLDQRRVIVRLTEKGRVAMTAMLRHVYRVNETAVTHPAGYTPLLDL